MKIIIYMLMLCFVITGCSIGKKDNPNEKPEQKNVSMKMLRIQINQISQMKKQLIIWHL